MNPTCWVGLGGTTCRYNCVLFVSFRLFSSLFLSLPLAVLLVSPLLFSSVRVFSSILFSSLSSSPFFSLLLSSSVVLLLFFSLQFLSCFSSPLLLFVSCPFFSSLRLFVHSDLLFCFFFLSYLLLCSFWTHARQTRTACTKRDNRVAQPCGVFRCPHNQPGFRWQHVPSSSVVYVQSASLPSMRRGSILSSVSVKNIWCEAKVDVPMMAGSTQFSWSVEAGRRGVGHLVSRTSLFACLCLCQSCPQT